MDIREFYGEWKNHPRLREVGQWMVSGRGALQVQGLSGSAAALTLHAAAEAAGLPAVYVLRDADEAGYFYNDLLQVDDDSRVFYLPSSYKKRFREGAPRDPANLTLRTEALSRLRRTGGWSLVTSPEAFAERVVTRAELENETLFLRQGQRITMDEVERTLCRYHFTQVDFVYEPGQYSVRGSIVDVFSYSSDLPFRVDFWGDEIDSLRTFDVSSQTSVESKDEISVVSNAVQQASGSERTDLFDFFPDNCLIAFLDGATARDVMERLYRENAESGLFLPPEDLAPALARYRLLEWGNHPLSEPTARIAFDESPQPVFHKNFDLVADDFAKRQALGYRIQVLSDNPKQHDRLKDIFAERPGNLAFDAVSGVLHEGFIDHDLKVCVYTDHQLFDRFHKYQLKSARTRAGKVVMSLKELMQIQVGDYIVHADHGVGRFGGLVRMNVGGNMQELIKLTFRDDDILFVNLHSLHRISKYKGREGEAPRLNKLGTAAWNNLKEKTKKKVKDIARELIALYARRRQEKGFQFSPDSYLQEELESSFLYEDTPDQSKATLAVKKDMESPKPMDRLICGDVGFGKTEVAMRAAFKAVTDNKQVAVLVPTTVLAFQHYKSFTRRLKRFPCRVDYLSRARSAAEVKEIKAKLESGAIDILIGTHKILSKDLKFKDLGLLIIDEEQKFGVSAKEKLRQMRANIDTLTLTATPIPRTLQFSLMGARDLSVISTPPPNRYPVQTEIIGFDADTIREAIEYELARGGQVFFVNNRVSNLPELEEFLHRLVPKARIAVGHGQMDSEKLESVILRFIDGEYDILLATSIIESGIDIPNVNTMFINSAQNFGLSDLHQLRGRVGRTNKKAFCYLIAPPLASLPPDSRRRLQAIENFADLGSGIHIAMQDLDIRGAGNILGGEQSGFISDLGYETYHRILDEAVYELKHDEFKDVFRQENEQELGNCTAECVFESDQELLLPADYVESVSERMELYRRLDGLKDETALTAFEQELTDRFGPIPDAARDLIAVVRLRWLAMPLGIEKLTLKKQRLTAYFLSVEHRAFYQSDKFGAILNYIASHPDSSHMSPLQDKPSCWFSGVKSVREATDLLKRF